MLLPPSSIPPAGPTHSSEATPWADLAIAYDNPENKPDRQCSAPSKAQNSDLAQTPPCSLKQERPSLTSSTIKVDLVAPLRSGFKSPSIGPTSQHAKAKSKGLAALDLKLKPTPISSPSPRHLPSLARKIALADLRKADTVVLAQDDAGGGFCVNTTPIPTPTATATVSATPASPRSPGSPFLAPDITSVSQKLKSKSQKLLRKLSVPAWKWKGERGLFFGRKQRNHVDRTIISMNEEEYNGRSEAHQTHNLVSFYQAQAMSSIDLRSSPRRGEDCDAFARDPCLRHQASSGHDHQSSTASIPPILQPFSLPSSRLHKAQSARHLRDIHRQSHHSTEAHELKHDRQYADPSIDVSATPHSVEEPLPRLAARARYTHEFGQSAKGVPSSQTDTSSSALALGEAPGVQRYSPHHQVAAAPYLSSSPKLKNSSPIASHHVQSTELQAAHAASQYLLTVGSQSGKAYEVIEQRSELPSPGAASSSRSSRHDHRGPTDDLTETPTKAMKVSTTCVSPSPLRSTFTSSPIAQSAQLHREGRRTLYSTATLHDAFQYDDVASSTPTRLVSPSRASSTLSPTHFSRRGSAIDTNTGSEDTERVISYDSVLSLRSGDSMSSTALASADLRTSVNADRNDDVRIKEQIRAACARQEDFVRVFNIEYAKKAQSPRPITTTTATTAGLKSSSKGRQGCTGAGVEASSVDAHRISTLISGRDQVALAMSLLEGKDGLAKTTKQSGGRDTTGVGRGSTSLTLVMTPTLPSPKYNERQDR